MKRPPRPNIVAPELMEYAHQKTNAMPREIEDVRETEAGVIVWFKGGLHANIIVPDDRPDALGQTGLLHYPTPTMPTSRNPRVGTYAEPTERIEVEEPWTVAHLEYAGSKYIPGNVYRDERSRLEWVADDPRKAYAMWARVAFELFDNNLKAAAGNIPLASECRRIILASGWLSEREAAKL